jgi:hypothetical protein
MLKQEIVEVYNYASYLSVYVTRPGEDEGGSLLSRRIQDGLQENLVILDHTYPKIKIDLLLVESEEFSPSLVAKLSSDTGILPSFMFIRCPGRSFKYNIGEFDGMRTVMR